MNLSNENPYQNINADIPPSLGGYRESMDELVRQAREAQARAEEERIEGLLKAMCSKVIMDQKEKDPAARMVVKALLNKKWDALIGVQILLDVAKKYVLKLKDGRQSTSMEMCGKQYEAEEFN